jgi:hypothetical protein
MHAYTAVIEIHGKSKVSETYANGRKSDEVTEKLEIARVVIRAANLEELKAKAVAHIALVSE